MFVTKNMTEVAKNFCGTKNVTEVTKNVTEVTKKGVGLVSCWSTAVYCLFDRAIPSAVDITVKWKFIYKSCSKNLQLLWI